MWKKPTRHKTASPNPVSENEPANLTPRPLPHLIGIGGHLRSGKDTVANHLVTAHGYVKIGMSDPLHEALLILDPLIERYPGAPYTDRYSQYVERVGYTRAKEVPEVRRLLQRLGTEVGRNLLGEDVWVDATLQRIHDLHAQGHRHVVITGIRYPNEVAMVRTLRGSTWWVERPIQPLQASQGGRRNGKTSALRGLAPHAVIEDEIEPPPLPLVPQRITDRIKRLWLQENNWGTWEEDPESAESPLQPGSPPPANPTPPKNLRRALDRRPPERPEEPLGDPGVPGGPENASQRPHTSEQSVSSEDFDLIFVNNGTIEGLHRTIENVLRHHR